MFRIPGHKAKAFSLPELLVVMVLSSLIAGIIYFVYYTVSAYQLRLTKKMSREADMSLLYFTLKKDVENCKVVSATGPSAIHCIFADGKQVLYSVRPDSSLLRQQNHRMDTFKLTVSLFSVWWDNKVLTAFPAATDKFQFEIKTSSGFVVAGFGKQYDASSLMEIIPKDSLP